MTNWVVPVLAVGLLAGCSPAAEESPSPSPSPGPTRSVSPMPTPEQPATPTESPSPTVEPSPTFSRSYPPPDPDETEEQRAIREGWEAYRAVRDRFSQDPDLTDWTETQHVTTGVESQQIIERISQTREANLRVVGHSVFRDVEVGASFTDDHGARQAIVTSCFDPTYRYTVDIDTGEPSEVRLLDTLRETVTMERMPDGSWRAALYLNEAEPC